MRERVEALLKEYSSKPSGEETLREYTDKLVIIICSELEGHFDESTESNR